jgi:hypothetical protein
VIASPLRPRQRQESGIAAAGQLAHRGTPYGASLSFATTTHLWPLSDPPSRKPRSAQPSRTGIARSIPGRALASSVSGSPCQGPGTGLPPPISTSVPGTPAAPSPCGLRLDDDRVRLSPRAPATSLLCPKPAHLHVASKKKAAPHKRCHHLETYGLARTAERALLLALTPPPKPMPRAVGFDELMPKSLATATVERLLHHAHVLITEGQDSYRLAQATAGKGVMPLD